MGELKAWDSATNSNVPLDKTGEDGLAPKQYRLPTNFAFGATETHRESRRQIMLIAMKLPCLPRYFTSIGPGVDGRFAIAFIERPAPMH